jgi:hypothetical protein
LGGIDPDDTRADVGADNTSTPANGGSRGWNTVTPW